MRYDEKGWEVPDATPVALPVGFKRPETLQEQMARMIRSEFLLRRQAEGFESPEEADNFELADEEEDWTSPWELKADQEADALDVVKAESTGRVVDAPVPPSAGGLGSGKPGEGAPASVPGPANTLTNT